MVTLISEMCTARAEAESGAEAARPAKVSNMKKILAAAPPKNILAGGVTASASLGNSPPGDRSAPASTGDIAARRPLRTRLYGQYVRRAAAP